MSRLIPPSQVGYVPNAILYHSSERAQTPVSESRFSPASSFSKLAPVIPKSSSVLVHLDLNPVITSRSSEIELAKTTKSSSNYYQGNFGVRKEEIPSQYSELIPAHSNVQITTDVPAWRPKKLQPPMTYQSTWQNDTPYFTSTSTSTSTTTSTGTSTSTTTTINSQPTTDEENTTVQNSIPDTGMINKLSQLLGNISFQNGGKGYVETIDKDDNSMKGLFVQSNSVMIRPYETVTEVSKRFDGMIHAIQGMTPMRTGVEEFSNSEMRIKRTITESAKNPHENDFEHLPTFLQDMNDYRVEYSHLGLDKINYLGEIKNPIYQGQFVSLPAVDTFVCEEWFESLIDIYENNQTWLVENGFGSDMLSKLEAWFITVTPIYPEYKSITIIHNWVEDNKYKINKSVTNYCRPDLISSIKIENSYVDYYLQSLKEYMHKLGYFW